MYRLTKFVIVLTAVAFSCWPALAGPIVPYKDSASGIVTALVLTSPTTATQSVAATGVATHLGRFQSVGTHTLTDVGLPTGDVLNGQFTTVAADGSTISGTYSGKRTSIAPGVNRFDLTFLVLQGTGRLAGVTGTIQTVIMADGPSPGSPFTYASLGTLTFP
jgi:hypothetical protein